MKLLLDTHMLLWSLSNDRRLSPAARRLIKSPHNSILASAASIWEIGLKHSIGRIEIELSEIGTAIIASGFEPLHVTAHHAITASQLPLHHRDPFDRMLVAQAIVETANLLTRDSALQAYGAAVMIV